MSVATTTSSSPIRARVAVVGAGPAGTATALRLAQLGVQDVVLLDAHDFPRDKTCGSGISPRCIKLLQQLQVWDRIEPQAYPISGIRLVGPSGRDFVASAGDKVEAVICLRRHLDYAILEAALELGVRFVPHFHGRQALIENNGHGGRWVGVSAKDGREVRADMVVVANGATSKLVSDHRPKKIIHTIMGWWKNVPFIPHTLEMLYDPLVRPYYGWLFPEAEDRVNIGITYEDDDLKMNARERFAAFLDKHYAQRLAKAEQIGGFKGHPISYTYGIRELYSPGRVIVGEAGRMVHPATGEGIYFAMQSGAYAAEAIAEVVSGKRTEPEAMRQYQFRCRTHFTASFLAGGLFRSAIKTPVLDWMLAAGDRPMVKKLSARIMAHM